MRPLPPPRCTRAAGAPKRTRSPGASAPLLGGGKGGKEAHVALEEGKLRSLLERFGEFPAKYRLLIW